MKEAEQQEVAIMRPQAAGPLSSSQGPIKIAEAMFKSGYFPDVGSMAQAVVKIVAGEELGLSPMASIQGITMIKGKIGMTGNLMATLVQKDPEHDYRVKESTAEKAEIEFLRNGEPIGVSVFTMEDAQRANLVKNGGAWTMYPKAMLFNRALTQGVRMFCPIVTNGSPAYTIEELSGSDFNSGPSAEPEQPIQDAEVVDPLDPQKVEHLIDGIRLIGLSVREVNMMLGSVGIDALPSSGSGAANPRDHFARISGEQFDALSAEIERKIQDLDANQPDSEPEPEIQEAEVVEDAEVEGSVEHG